MAEPLQGYEMVLFKPDGEAVYGMFRQNHTGAPATMRSVLSSVSHLLGAANLRMLEFANPENPLHWHVLFWDAEGLTKGLPLNAQVNERMSEISEDFPPIYGSAALVRDKFWSDE